MAPLFNNDSDDAKKDDGPPSAMKLSGIGFDTVTKTVTVILAAIACKALMGKAVEKAKEKYVQWATERQIKQWQRELQKQMQNGGGKDESESESESESEEEESPETSELQTKAKVKRAREWNREGGGAEWR